MSLDHRSRLNLAAVCRSTYYAASMIVRKWNVSSGDFHGADHTKPRMKRAKLQSIVTLQGDPTAPGHGYMAWELSMLKRAMLACFNMGATLQRLDLVRVPLLTIGFLRVLLPSMSLLTALSRCHGPNIQLRSLTDSFIAVVDCDLVGLREAPGLLEAARACNEAVLVDFWPSEASQRIKDVDTDKALPSILADLLPKASSQQAGILAPHGHFRRWLQRVAPALSDDFLLALEREETDEIVEHHRQYMERCGALQYVDVALNDATLIHCYRHGERLAACFFPSDKLKRYVGRSVCWACVHDGYLRWGRRRHISIIADQIRLVEEWLQPRVTLPQALRRAARDRVRPLAGDKTWHEVCRARAQRKAREQALLKWANMNHLENWLEVKGRHQYTRDMEPSLKWSPGISAAGFW